MRRGHFHMEHFDTVSLAPPPNGPAATLTEAIAMALMASEELRDATPGGIHNGTATVPEVQPYLILTERGTAGRAFKTADSETILETYNFKAVANELAKANAIMAIVHPLVNEQRFHYATGFAGPAEEGRRDSGENRGRVAGGEQSFFSEISWRMFHRVRGS